VARYNIALSRKLNLIKMKILIYYSSHRQKDEIRYASQFFNRTDFLKKNSQVMIHCDNNAILDEELRTFIEFDTEIFLSRSPQTFPVHPTGYFNGFWKGLSKNFDFFKNYDYVIHLTPDVYITNETEIVNILIEEYYTDNVFIVDYHPEHNSTTPVQYCCDFFVFKPNCFEDFFCEHDDNNPIPPEFVLYSKIHEHSIKHRKIKRVGALSHQIDSFGLIHNHDNNHIVSILNS
jgi:hypothetical protein